MGTEVGAGLSGERTGLNLMVALTSRNYTKGYRVLGNKCEPWGHGSDFNSISLGDLTFAELLGGPRPGARP